MLETFLHISTEKCTDADAGAEHSEQNEEEKNKTKPNPKPVFRNLHKSVYLFIHLLQAKATTATTTMGNNGRY